MSLTKLDFSTSAVESAFGLNSLPGELIIHIFSYLLSNELLYIRSVCKKWLILSDENGLWKKLFEKNIGKHVLIYPKLTVTTLKALKEGYVSSALFNTNAVTDWKSTYQQYKLWAEILSICQSHTNTYEELEKNDKWKKIMFKSVRIIYDRYQSFDAISHWSTLRHPQYNKNLFSMCGST